MLERLEEIGKEDYISIHTSPECPVLQGIARDANNNCTHPRMVSGHIQGALLRFIVKIAKPRKILEIGTFVGYATVAMAQALEDGGVLTTLEVNDELEDTIRKNIRAGDVEDRVEVIIGNAIDVIKKLHIEDYQLVYIDADKLRYPDYYKAIVPHLKSDALIIADNTLWGNKVWHNEYQDAHTRAIREFNSLVANDDSVEQVVLGLRDGISLIRKK